MLPRPLILPLFLLAIACGPAPESTDSESASQALERSHALDVEAVRLLEDARRLATRRKTQARCDESDFTTQEAILSALQKAVDSDERARPFVAREALFREVLDHNLYFDSLTGELDDELAELASLLPGKTFFGPTLEGNVSRIDFASEGKLTFVYEVSDENGRVSARFVEGTWTLEPRAKGDDRAQRIQLVLDDDGATYVLTKDPTNVEFSISPASADGRSTGDAQRARFTTVPSECDG